MTVGLWRALEARRAARAGRAILDLFADGDRARVFSARADGLLFDYSKTQIDAGALSLLLDLARGRDVEGKRDAMFAGEPINATEGRAVLHTALRAERGPIEVDGGDVLPGIRAVRARMAAFAEDVRAGRTAGPGGPFADVVNIGIGGSDLGPAMATRALAPYRDGPRLHYVSNVDGAHIADTLKGLDPSRTLVIAASKTFTTVETMTNARTARDWLAAAVDDPGAQFAAISSATDRAAAFGIDPARVFGFGDWVGGRYSLWGPIGLGVMLATGAETFDRFLAGGRAMDAHFRTAAPARNLPVLLALVGIWHHQVCGHPTRAVLPYEQRLSRLPAYLQQLEMESNGKGVTLDGAALDRAAGPVVWGEPGTGGQHAFHQLLHQGRQVVPCEFMVGARGHEAHLDHHHRLLLANCLAQSEALMRGRPQAAVRAALAKRGLAGAELDVQAAHRAFPGNRPSTTLLYDRLTPYVLGQVIALYEHRVFVEGAILGVNSFDQWGVELGKELAQSLVPALAGEGAADDRDGSTRMLLAEILARRTPA